VLEHDDLDHCGDLALPVLALALLLQHYECYARFRQWEFELYARLPLGSRTQRAILVLRDQPLRCISVASNEQ
jgi:hypothetical protein